MQVVNKLSKEHVHATMQEYGVNYDRIWIYDKIHHEINQFCSRHTLQEVYIDKFDQAWSPSSAPSAIDNSRCMQSRRIMARRAQLQFPCCSIEMKIYNAKNTPHDHKTHKAAER